LLVDKERACDRIGLMMSGYTKLFSSIITSTIWREDNVTRIVWITMLALRNQRHVVEGSIPGLADVARVSVDECRAAILKLESPDPDSRSKVHDGRRIVPVDGGWLIVNGEKYRRAMSLDDRREYLRQKKAEERARVNKDVNTRQQKSTKSTQTETETETETKRKPKYKASGDAVSGEGFWIRVDGNGMFVPFPDPLKGSEVFREAWARWIEYRRQQHRFAYKPIGAVACLRDAAKLGSPEAAAAAIDFSIGKGWRGIFAEHKSSQGSSTYAKNKERVAAVKAAMDQNGAARSNGVGREPVRRALAAPGAERERVGQPDGRTD
jgi:hypothetical protein